MINIEEAYSKVMNNTPGTKTRETPLEDSIGKVLIEDAVSDTDIPPFDKSAMDGFALKAGDTPGTLNLKGESVTGRLPDFRIESGECARISTGAPVPEGADTVEMVEKTEMKNQKTVSIPEPVKKGNNICIQGEDTKKGDLLLKAGASIDFLEIGLLASAGYSTVKTGMLPEVCLIATGDELVPVENEPGPGQIRESNTPFLKARLKPLAGKLKTPGIVGDTREVLKNELEKGLKSDVLITTGGVSVGRRDYIKEILRELGVELHVTKVSQKPGKPFVFGTKGEKLVFGLPGNPVSAAVTCELYIVPALKKMGGGKSPGNRWLNVKLEKDISIKKRDRTLFMPAAIKFTDNTLSTVSVDIKGSADIIGFSEAEALIKFPSGTTGGKKGEVFETLILRNRDKISSIGE